MDRQTCVSVSRTIMRASICFICLTFFASSSQATNESSYPPNEQAMFGGIAKNEAQKKADEQLIEGVEKQGVPLATASHSAITTGFSSLQQKDYAMAIKRFNQAWLLDPNNGDAYYGFAMIAMLRDRNPGETDKFFKLAIQKGNADRTLWMSYAQFLFSQGRFGEGVPCLQQLLKVYPPAPGARAMLAFAYRNTGNKNEACRYAQATIENKERLARGNLNDYCGQP